MVAFGRPYIANPDLPQRTANGWPLVAANPATMYGDGAAGFTDSPAYAASAAAPIGND